MATQTLEALVESMASGWRVQSPVYYRRRWHTPASHKLGYYFILRKGNETDLIIVPDAEPVRHLIETHKLKVIAA